MFYKNCTSSKLTRFAWYSVKIRVIFGVRFERRKVDQKQTYMKTETCKLYGRVFWIFLPNCIKIDPYNFELYRFKVGAFLRHTVITTARSKRDGRIQTLWATMVNGTYNHHCSAVNQNQRCIYCRMTLTIDATVGHILTRYPSITDAIDYSASHPSPSVSLQASARHQFTLPDHGYGHCTCSRPPSLGGAPFWTPNISHKLQCGPKNKKCCKEVFCEHRMQQNGTVVGAPPQTPLRELTVLPQTRS